MNVFVESSQCGITLEHWLRSDLCAFFPCNLPVRVAMATKYVTNYFLYEGVL